MQYKVLDLAITCGTSKSLAILHVRIVSRQFIFIGQRNNIQSHVYSYDCLWRHLARKSVSYSVEVAQKLLVYSKKSTRGKFDIYTTYSVYVVAITGMEQSVCPVQYLLNSSVGICLNLLC